jgi:hypothetical protein
MYVKTKFISVGEMAKKLIPSPHLGFEQYADAHTHTLQCLYASNFSSFLGLSDPTNKANSHWLWNTLCGINKQEAANVAWPIEEVRM